MAKWEAFTASAAEGTEDNGDGNGDNDGNANNDGDGDDAAPA